MCEKAGIQAFELVEKSQNSGRDACKVNLNDLSENELSKLHHLIHIHQKVAHFFRVSVSDLFTKPLKVEIKEYVFGPMISTAGATSINMGSFPGDNFNINTGVYLHELGHVLGYANNPLLPIMMEDLSSSKLFSESFADLLALSLHGNIMTPSEKKPNCLDRIRYISTFQSYNYPQEYFQNFSEARIRKCCESLERNSSERSVLNFCKAATDWFSSDIDLSYPFDPESQTSIDDHQIGIPIISFLKSFSQKTNKPLKTVFEKILFPDKVSSQEFYECTFTRGLETLVRKRIGLFTIESLLQDFSETLDPQEYVLYNSLYKKHALEKGFAFAKKNHKDNVKDKMKNHLKSLHSETYSRCIDQSCTLSCTFLN